MSNSGVKEIVEKLKVKIIEAEQSNMKLSETDTRQGLINPLFRALGWDFSDFTLVKSELRHKDYNDPVDYAFFSSRSKEKPVLLLEAKSLGTNLSDTKIVKQICTYLGEMGVQWGVISDGNKYIMYNSIAGTSFKEQKFLTLQIKTVNTEDGLTIDDLSEKLVALMSKECLENDKIQRTYEEHMVNTQVENALQSLLCEPFDTLAAAIKKEFKQERVQANPSLKVTTRQIINYLKNISDEEGAIPISTEIEDSSADEQVIHSVASNTSIQDNKNDHENELIKAKRISVSDLLKENLIQEGDNWRMEYRGEVFWSRVTGNGELELNGTVYPNPSKAGIAVREGRSCNGWNAWTYKTLEGKWVKVENLRSIYRDRHGIAAIKKHKNEQEVVPQNSASGF